MKARRLIMAYSGCASIFVFLMVAFPSAAQLRERVFVGRRPDVFFDSGCGAIVPSAAIGFGMRPTLGAAGLFHWGFKERLPPGPVSFTGDSNSGHVRCR
jgi:hypothetical protein